MPQEAVLLFDKVKPIILKLKRQYFIQLWDHDDWLQEGRIVLYCLLESHPELSGDDKRLYAYFKTKFSSHLKDMLRQQESQKRRFHKLAYDEIGDVAHCIPSSGLSLDDYVAYQGIVEGLEQELTAKEYEQFQALVRGERFEGRRALIRKVGPYFKDFGHRALG